MRHAEIQMLYEGQDISRDIVPFLQSFEYTENAANYADSLSISLSNKDYRWFNGWLPQLGDKIITRLTTHDWHYPKENLELACGQLTIDQPEFSGPPDVMTLKAISVEAAAGFTDVPVDTTWNEITLQELSQEIAARYNLKLFYDGPDIVIKALKRTKQSDAELLAKTCEKYNARMKCYADKLVIYTMQKREKADPAVTLEYGSSDIQSYSMQAPLIGTGYSAVTIKFMAPGKQMIEATYPPGTTAGKIVILQQACDSIAQAEQMAAAKLRTLNQRARTARFTTSLDLRITACCTVMVKGFGDFDGKYFVDTCRHTYGSGAASTEIDVHMCLDSDY